MTGLFIKKYLRISSKWKITLHVIGFSCLFPVSYFLSVSSADQPVFYFQFLPAPLHLVIFYVSYIALIPFLLFKNKKLEKEKVTAELSLLKHQINPHFIFNTLNSIYSLSISNSKEVPESILKLSSILRYVLYNSEDNMLELNDEVKIIKDYIQLQELRLTDKVTLNYRLICEPSEYKIEPLIIITLLENAFKYGADTSSDSFIDIFLIIINGKLTLRVRNKIARRVSPGRDSGIGLNNIQRRLDLTYPNRYKYNTEIKNMGYTAFLEIELA